MTAWQGAQINKPIYAYVLEGKTSAVPSWLAAVAAPGSPNIDAAGAEIMGGGTSTQISLKALLQREIEAGHQVEVREILTGSVHALPWAQKTT